MEIKEVDETERREGEREREKEERQKGSGSEEPEQIESTVRAQRKEYKKLSWAKNPTQKQVLVH